MIDMRTEFTVIFICLITALGACAVLAHRSRRAIGTSVCLLIAALIPPVLGNLIVVCSHTPGHAAVGYYIYFIGMDFVMYNLLRFCFEYCGIPRTGFVVRYGVNVLLLTDIIQLLLNQCLHHAFGLEEITVDASPYFRMVPHLGQALHRIVDYGIFFAVLIIFCVKLIHAPRIYFERFSAILFTMIAAGIWQTFYIFSRTPIDRSMIGFGVFGLLIYYFSLRYRPMRLLDSMLSRLVSGLPEALFFFDINDKCIWANRPALELVGLKEDELDKVCDHLYGMFGEHEHPEREWTARHVIGDGSDAQYYVVEKHMVTDENLRDAGKFLSIRDNTEEEQRLQHEIYNATHDSLTGLYTREYLFERIRKTIAQNPWTHYYVAFLNVRNFKIINDIFGNAFGDHALKYIANSLHDNLPRTCLYGRLSGDTFGFLIPVSDFDPEHAEALLADLAVEHGGISHHLLLHQGVYEIRDKNIEVSVMFDRAHLALYTITDEYKNHIAYYDDEIRDKVLWDQHISSQLKAAIAERQILPYFQPIMERSGKCVGAELLARWQHPEKGFLSPGSFIPVFEKNGMIVELDKYMWRCACEALARWGEAEPELFISVNISPKDFYFIDVIAEIKGLVREYGIAPARLRIEITETVMMTEADDRMRILQEFRNAGFIVEMDDFGSGYSSLNLLKDMPVDVLKIDMKFLGKTDEKAKARTIMHNILNLSEDLGIASLTEGVETEEQYRMLSEMGCKLFQGFHFASPMPLEDFEKFCS